MRKRRIEVRPRVERKTEPKIINNKTPFPEFPNFPQVYEVPSNDNINITNVTNKNSNFENQNNQTVTETETLPLPQPLTMSKSSSSSRLKNHNAVRRKIDALPVNLTPGNNGGNGKGQQSAKFRKSLPPLYDYYDDYYYYGVVHQILSPISNSESTIFLTNIYYDFFFQLAN